MVEVSKNLFVGSADEYEQEIKPKMQEQADSWFVVHACKDPYHRQLLGYTDRVAPKDHPEYLWANRPNQLYLNLVDAYDSRYIPKELINYALLAITEKIMTQKVFVHCNEGKSRSPSLAFLYLIQQKQMSPNFFDAETKFRRIYPAYEPNFGIYKYIMDNWNDYYKV